MILTYPVLRSISTKPKTAFPFRKPKIAPIQCFEAPEFCQFLMIVTFQSLTSSGLHFSHLTSAWACLILVGKNPHLGKGGSTHPFSEFGFLSYYFLPHNRVTHEDLRGLECQNKPGGELVGREQVTQQFIAWTSVWRAKFMLLITDSAFKACGCTDIRHSLLLK